MLEGLIDGLIEINFGENLVLFTDRPFDNERFRSLKQHIIPLNTNNPAKRLLWDHLLLGVAAKRSRVDCLICPIHVRPLYAPIPTITIVHDMMYHMFPEEWGFFERNYMRLGVEYLTSRSTFIVFDSQTTKADFNARIDFPVEAQEVVYPGVPRHIVQLRDKYTSAANRVESTPFILGLGSIYPRKNIEALVEAFSAVAHRIPHRLAIAGNVSGGINDTVQQLPENIRSRIEFLGLVSDERLVELYSTADFMVFPSKYEGFGLPALEAMYCGCPLICANNGALPEVTGGAAKLVDIENLNQMAEAILELTNCPKRRSHLSQLGRARADLFTITKPALKLLNVIRKVCKDLSK